MDYKGIAKKILELQQADLDLRNKLVQQGQMGNGYHPEMEQLHTQNANALNAIIDSIGYPTIAKVGQQASEASWLYSIRLGIHFL